MASFSHRGHRESLSLGERNHKAAAAHARDAFVYLKANGWEIWREQFKPDRIRLSDMMEAFKSDPMIQKALEIFNAEVKQS